MSRKEARNGLYVVVKGERWANRKGLRLFMWLGVFLTRLRDFLAVGVSGEATMVLHEGVDRRLWVVNVVAKREKEKRGGRK